MKKIGKKLVLGIVLTGLLVGLTACGKSDPVKEDLYSYLADMSPVQELQRTAVEEYNSYVSDDDSDSQALLTALNDSIIPTYETYLEQLEAVAPETEEVQNLKQLCTDGSEKQLEALQKVAEAIDACDTDMLNEADSMITEAEALFSDYEAQLQTLADEHEIALTTDSSDVSDDTSESGAESSSAE